MTRVELWCTQIRVAHLIEMLQRGPGFTRLPPARYYHGHKNEIPLRPIIGKRGVPDYGGASRFTVSRRKWMLAFQTDPVLMPLPLRMPEKPYTYCDMDAPISRTATALKILEDVKKVGEVCGVWRRAKKNSKGKSTQGFEAGHNCCFCIKLGTSHITHECEHGEW